MAQILLEYYHGHGKYIRSHVSIKTSCRYWTEFCGEQTVEEATQADNLDRFIKILTARGHSTAYIQRIIGVGKAALNRAHKRGVIPTLPYVPSVKVQYGKAKGRMLSEKEVALLLTHANDYVRLFIYIMLGTVCRPEAAFELTREQLDFENRLIDLNPLGRTQTKKVRPIVKMPEHLATILEGAPDGPLITFRGKPVTSVRTAWLNLIETCGFDQTVQPYSLRHTMARWLRKQGVSAWDTAAQLGHKSREHRTTEIYAPFAPDYLGDATLAIDAYFDELRASYAPEIKSHFQVVSHQITDIVEKIGAGDERQIDLKIQ